MPHLLRGLLSTPGQHSRQAGVDRWQPLPNPVPGHSSIDGLPVPVVAIRRDSVSGQLEVVRGHHPTAEWPGFAAPRDAKRHVIPASSFIPHPRRELIIDDQRFFFSTVANPVRCAACHRRDLGFGFVGSQVPVEGTEPTTADHSALCEHCAQKRGRLVTE